MVALSCLSADGEKSQYQATAFIVQFLYAISLVDAHTSATCISVFTAREDRRTRQRVDFSVSGIFFHAAEGKTPPPLSLATLPRDLPREPTSRPSLCATQTPRKKQSRNGTYEIVHVDCDVRSG